MGLAAVAIAVDDLVTARGRMNSAVELLLSIGRADRSDRLAREQLAAIANEFHVRLDDLQRAEEIIASASSL